MAETPPLQIQATAHTPPTPLHGPAYDNHGPSRYSTRSGQRNTSRELLSTPEAKKGPRTARSAISSKSSRRSSQNSHSDLPQIHSPQPSPMRKSTRRVQVISPSSPGFAPSSPSVVTAASSHRTLYPSATTTMTEGMLPTPVKTPKKKPQPKVIPAARALFQDQPIIGEEVSSPRRNRKPKRYNGFSLESFSADAAVGPSGIQIFTDSRDKVPEVDVSESNPFVKPSTHEHGSSSRKLAGTSKRRKVSGERSKDAQVEEALKNDEGMVYVFRGKKVFRRFDDADEEEEVIDTSDLGLLTHTPNGNDVVKPLKTLTRKSIKPTRLFQTEKQTRAREVEKEEETATDIEELEDPSPVEQIEPISSRSNHKVAAKASNPASRSLRSGNKVSADEEAKVDEPSNGKEKEVAPKKGSPFDSWKRVKGSASSSTIPVASKSRKRGAEDTLESEETVGKKMKAA